MVVEVGWRVVVVLVVVGCCLLLKLWLVVAELKLGGWKKSEHTTHTDRNENEK